MLIRFAVLILFICIVFHHIGYTRTMSVFYKSCLHPSRLEGFLPIANPNYSVKDYMSKVSVISLLQLLNSNLVIVCITDCNFPLHVFHIRYLFFRVTLASRSYIGWCFFHILFIKDLSHMFHFYMACSTVFISWLQS